MIEIFGKKVEIVENDVSNACNGCALEDICYPWDAKKINYPCMGADGRLHRHFKIVREKKKIIIK